MSESPIRVLIVEDESMVRDTLNKAFERYQLRRFEVLLVEHWKQLIDPRAAIHRDSPCDIGIFDLGFSSDGLKRPANLLALTPFPELILSVKLLKRESCKVIYSAYNDPMLIAQAFQYGAAAYIFKGTSLPYQVPLQIDMLLKQQTADLRNRECFPSVMNWLDGHREELRTRVRALAKADGRLLTPPLDDASFAVADNSWQEWFIAVILDAKNDPQIVAIGRTRLEALLLYTHKKTEAGDNGIDWPREPFLHSLRMNL